MTALFYFTTWKLTYDAHHRMPLRYCSLFKISKGICPRNVSSALKCASRLGLGFRTRRAAICSRPRKTRRRERFQIGGISGGADKTRVDGAAATELGDSVSGSVRLITPSAAEDTDKDKLPPPPALPSRLARRPLVGDSRGFFFSSYH